MSASFLVLLLSMLGDRGAAQEEPPLVGTWEGDIEAGAQKIRTVLHLGRDAEGELSGTVDSPDQGAFGFTVGEIEVEGRALSFTTPETHGRWTGSRSEDGRRLEGAWIQRGAELPLTLRRVDSVPPLVGRWAGVLAVAGAELRIEFHVGTRSDGSLGASMKSPDQSAQLIPVDPVELEADALRLGVPAAGASFTGTWDREADRIEGEFAQGPGSFPLVLERQGAPPRKRRPQTPRPPFPYRVEELEYRNEEAGITLAGTLTLPAGEGPFAAALLITGSGPQDRDETIHEHKPFAVLADFLTRRGIAVLRVDDRGVGGSGGSLATATSADLATDVHAGLDHLESRPEIDAQRLGLIGHSEGGLIAPMVARERESLAFAVLLAGPGVGGDRILYDQAALILAADGMPAAVIEQNRQRQQRLFSILKSDEPMEVVRERLREVLRAEAQGSEAEGSEAEEAVLEAQLAQIASPWFRFFVQYDPQPALRELHCPVLGLFGELDLQVPHESNRQAMAAALEEAGNEDVTLRSLPGLNHLFQRATTGSPTEYEQIEQTFDPEVLELMATWILARVGEGG